MRELSNLTGTHLYTINELSQILTVHTLPATGQPKLIARMSILDSTDSPHAATMGPAEIILLPSLSPSAPLLLLCSNRDSPSPEGDTIAAFSVDPSDGAKVERTEQGWVRGCGAHLRAMAEDDSGRFVAVAGRNGGGLSVLERVGKDGVRLQEVARLEGGREGGGSALGPRVGSFLYTCQVRENV
jgi:6-phosphogluconolactonase (cycloisomerase 2 family)